MWQAHYKTLLNSVKISSSKAFVERELHSIKDSSIVFRPIDIFDALKNAKTGKACGNWTCCRTLYLCRCYDLPREFMKTAIVPIFKNKSGNTSDKSNHAIALVTACSKIFESCLLKMLEHYLETHDHHFGFKSQHATDMCIFTVKSVIKYYKKNRIVLFSHVSSM